MKKMKQIFLFFLLLGGAILMSKCQDDNYLEEPHKQEIEIQKKGKSGKEKNKKKIKYKGLTVNHRFNSSENELKEKHTKKYLKKLYNKLRKNKKVKSKGTFSKVSDFELELPSPEVVFEASKAVIDNFPYEKLEGFNALIFDDGNSSDINMIMLDFENFTEADIESNNEIIEEYYSQNLDYLVLEEIANHPEKYDDIGDITMSRSGSEFTTYYCTLNLMIAGGYGFVRGTISYFLAGTRADDSSTNHYTNLYSSDSRRDAYRNILWNSLLSQYYFTISSKAPRLGFAKLVTNAREQWPCGGSSDVDAKQMDYHNNFIGRKIWDENTSYRTFWGWNVGLRKPSTSRLKDLAYAKVENQSCLIVKDHPNGMIFDFTTEETKEEVLKVNKDIAVYITGDIVPKKYTNQIIYDYSNCDEDDGLLDVQNRSIKKVSNQTLNKGITPIEEDNGNNCPRVITNTIITDACFISKDSNYNPY